MRQLATEEANSGTEYYDDTYQSHACKRKFLPALLVQLLLWRLQSRDFDKYLSRKHLLENSLIVDPIIQELGSPRDDQPHSQPCNQSHHAELETVWGKRLGRLAGRVLHSEAIALLLTGDF